MRWTSPLKVAQSLVPTVASGVVTWLVTGQPAYGALASFAALLLVAFLWLAERLISLPATLDREAQEKIAALTDTRDDVAAATARREKIGEFLGEARALHKRASIPGEGQPSEIEINEWWNGVAAYVAEEFGPAYVQQLVNGAGHVTYSSQGQSPHMASLQTVNIRLGELLDKIS
jgi:hypothetical protein